MTSATSIDLEITVQVNDLRADWKRVSDLANYCAEYVAYDLSQRERAENLLSTITNEVLEAVVHLAPLHTALLLRFKYINNALTLDIEHQVRGELNPSYMQFVQQLDNGNDEHTYLQLLTSEMNPDEYFNQLGLMILGYDFDVHLSLTMMQDTGQFRTHVDVPDEVLSK